MSQEQSTQFAASPLPAGGQQHQPPQSTVPRPIRFLDPFAIWFSPQALLRNSPTAQFPSRERKMRSIARVPAVEFDSQDGSVVIAAELPGLTAEDVKVELLGNVLIIQGEQRRDDDVRGPIGRSGRRSRHFYREIVLPQAADPDQMRAEFENGVLRVTVPMKTGGRRKQIAIISGKENTEKSGRSQEEA
jgi:HSP20 family molecular chaperone IbpA